MGESLDDKNNKAFAMFEEGKTAFSPDVKDFRLRSKKVTLPPEKLKEIERKLKRKTGLSYLYSLFRFTFLHFSFTY